MSGKPRLLVDALHLRDLVEGSGIDPAVVAERGYRSMSRPTPGNQAARDELKRLKIPGWAIREDRFFPGLLIPMYRATGERVSCQFRPHVAVPDAKRPGKYRKYASPVGQVNRLDVHPRNRDRIVDPTVPLWITEGVKKADALTSRGLCVVALTGVYNWRTQLGALGDWEDVPLRGRDVGVVFDSDASTNPNVLAAMARLGAWLKSKGARHVSYVVTPAQYDGKPTKGADDFFVAGGTLEELLRTATSTPPRPPGTGDTFTHSRMAEIVATDVLVGNFSWAGGLGWLAWDGRRWAACDDRAVVDAVREYFLDRYTRACRDAAEGAADRPVVDGWHRQLSASNIAAVVRLASGVAGVRSDPSEFDAHPDLLNVANGVVDLRSGELLPHDPDLRLTRAAPASYHPEARHPDWDAALQALPADVRGWYQLRMGQAVTGHPPPDDLLIVQVGGGENGKTTLSTGIRGALGEYHVNVSHRALLGDPSQHPTELMAFRGARVALVEETPEARRLSSVRLKQAVGTPQMRARYIRADEVEWEATHTLFLSSNYRPDVEETDHGTWRRLALLRFPYTFRKPGEHVDHDAYELPGDPLLRHRLQSGEGGQHEAVLAWLVNGARAWYLAHKQPAPLPDRVAADTRDWRGENDLVLAFVDERLVFDPASHIATSDLLAEFNDWVAGRGHRPWSDKTLASRFGSHGETTRHRVTKDRRRETDAGLSRPMPSWNSASTAPSGQFRAWLGVRFRLPTDAPQHVPVTLVTGSPDKQNFVSHKGLPDLLSQASQVENTSLIQGVSA